MAEKLIPHTQYKDYSGNAALDEHSHGEIDRMLEEKGFSIPDNFSIIGYQIAKYESSIDCKIYALCVDTSDFGTTKFSAIADKMRAGDKKTLKRIELPFMLSEAFGKDGFIKRFGAVMLSKGYFDDLMLEVEDYKE